MTADHADLRARLRYPVRVGVLTIALFFGVLGGWATLVPLARGTLAPGSVSTDGSRRTVQHLEGGIVKALLVRDGDRVAAGAALVALEQVGARTEFITYESQLLTLLAEQSRLIAEKERRARIAFDPRLLEADGAPERLQAMAAQEAIFEARRVALRTQKEILGQRIKQFEQQIEGLEIQNGANARQAALIDEEIGAVQALVDKGLERKPRLLALQRTEAQLDGARGETIAAIAKAREAIGETTLQILRLDSERDDDINTALADLRVKIAETTQGLDRAADRLARTTIRAPVDGTVMNLRFKTVGGVIGAGEPILDIVPARERLVIEARIPPLDIDTLRPGMAAEVVLSAYPRRSTPSVAASVAWVSADINQDDKTGQSYYSARIIVKREELERLPAQVILYPGMPTEVMIKSGSRTALDYLLEPLSAALRRSFTES